MKVDLLSYIETDSHYYFDHVDIEVKKWIPLFIVKWLVRRHLKKYQPELWEKHK